MHIFLHMICIFADAYLACPCRTFKFLVQVRQHVPAGWRARRYRGQRKLESESL